MTLCTGAVAERSPRREPFDSLRVDYGYAAGRVGPILIGRACGWFSRLAPELPKCQGDRAHIRHLLLQLIANAARAMSEYSRERGRLTILTRQEGGLARS